jgi:hypothetical protein
MGPVAGRRVYRPDPGLIEIITPETEILIDTQDR